MPHYGALDAICPETQFRLSHQSATGQEKLALLPELFPVAFPGVKTSRDRFLVDTDLDRLKARVSQYFDADVSHEEIARRYPAIMKTSKAFDARAVRETLVNRGGPDEHGFIPFAYRPFDNRWLYWEEDTKLLDRNRADYRHHVSEGTLWIEAREREAKEDFSRGTLIRHLGDNFGNGLSSFFPAWLHGDGLSGGATVFRRANLSPEAECYQTRLGASPDDVFFHALATLHDRAYREANAEALRIGWPRIPLPGWPEGEAKGAAAELTESAARGRYLAALLDPDTPVPGITEGALLREISSIAVPATKDGRNMTDDYFAVTAGWGSFGTGDAVMPGQGRPETRVYAPDERSVLGEVFGALGESTVDVYLNAQAYWRNVPTAVWEYQARRLPGA